MIPFLFFLYSVKGDRIEGTIISKSEWEGNLCLTFKFHYSIIILKLLTRIHQNDIFGWVPWKSLGKNCASFYSNIGELQILDVMSPFFWQAIESQILAILIP